MRCQTVLVLLLLLLRRRGGGGFSPCWMWLDVFQKIVRITTD
jgi:hypothetical protein